MTTFEMIFAFTCLLMAGGVPLAAGAYAAEENGVGDGVGALIITAVFIGGLLFGTATHLVTR